jgi:hypothetical protein
MTLPDAQTTFERVGVVGQVGDVKRHGGGSGCRQSASVRGCECADGLGVSVDETIEVD